MATAEKPARHSLTADKKGRPGMPAVSEIVCRLRSTAIHSLARMYRPQERLFAFRLRKDGRTEVLEGLSHRYTAIALIGLAGEDQAVASEVLANHSREEVCGRLLAGLDDSREIGEVALTAWAARIIRHSNASGAVEILRQMQPASGAYPTIELSWALMSLVAGEDKAADTALAEGIADRLMKSFTEESGIFTHGPARKGLAALGSYVSCFADFVYPIQALSRYHQLTGNARAGEIACRCAQRMCELQGPDGQWWWHYDMRTGRVVERYPVYSVHQDAMAPMALFALAEACRVDYSDSIQKGLQWLVHPPEVAVSLIDAGRNVIWRKVARREPRRLVRKLQAVASRVHPHLRVPYVDVLFPPVSIDYESRPYHMGWILHTWPVSRFSDSVNSLP